MNTLDRFDLDSWAENYPDTENRVRRLADRLCAQGTDVTNGYRNWLNLGFALSSELGEGGREIFHDLSRQNSSYNSAECDKQYTACLHARGGGITIRTFFQMAKNAGVTLSATSANPPSKGNTENQQNKGINKDLNPVKTGGGMAELTENHTPQGSAYTFSDKLKPQELGPLLQQIMQLHGKDAAKCDAQLIGVLNVLGGLMGGANGTADERSGIYGIYDGRRVYAPTYNIIYSGAGNDKGTLSFCKHLLDAVKQEMRRKYEAEKQDYENQLAEWESRGKKERGAQPKEPVFRDPFVPGNSSSSAVYRALNDNGSWGLMFDTEADTISGMLASDYGNYSDLMRKAHHHENLSMNRVTEKIHIDIEEPRLSIFLTCTPGQLPALFPSFENGLGSRFLFYCTPDDEVLFHNVFALKDTPLEDIYKKMGQELLPLFHALKRRAGHPIHFMMSSPQQQEFISTYQGMLKEQFAMLGKGIRPFIFRMALECFRYCMILSTLRKYETWRAEFQATAEQQENIFPEYENGLTCDDRDFQAAMTIMGCLMQHTARVYAVLAKEDDNPFAACGIKLSSIEARLYKALPEGNFTTATFIHTAAGHMLAERTAERMLGKFCHKYGILSLVSRGLYCKPQRKEEQA